MAWAFGREEMRKSACLLPKDTRSDNQTRYINLLFPLLSSTAKAGYNYIDGVRMNGHKFLKDDIFSVMLAVKIPLFHWGEGHGKIKSAKIELQKAEVMRDEMIEKMQLEVTRNYNILNEAELEVELTENAFSYAEENLQESSKSFETGMETLANFLEAQASWQKAYFEVISAKSITILQNLNT